MLRSSRRGLRTAAPAAFSLSLLALLAAPTSAALAADEASAAAQATPLQVAQSSTLTGEEGKALGATASQVSCDLNGNGLPDLAAGNYQTFDSSPGSVGAYVLLDAAASNVSAPIESQNAIRIIDSTRNYMGGVDVRCAGDVNGDSFDDLAVVAQGVGLFIVLGSADFSEVTLDDLGARGKTVLGSITRGNGVGDVDGDGVDEIAVTDTTGTVTVLQFEELAETSSLTDASGPRISGEGIDLVSISRAGDMNGDGREDLAVGASSWKAPGAAGFGTGAVWVVTDLQSDVTIGAVEIPGFRIDGPPRGYDLMGTSTVGLGDINGDGYDDLMIGGESDDPLPGSALVVLGGANGENVITDPTSQAAPAVRSAATETQRGWWISGGASGDHFGHAVGAVRMSDWSLLLIGAMDGTAGEGLEGSGYVAMVDSRALVDGSLPLSSTGALEAVDLQPAGAEGSEFVGGALLYGDSANLRLGRSFADLTRDPAGSRIDFAVGAPALFTWQGEVPSVHLYSLQVLPADDEGNGDSNGDDSSGSGNADSGASGGTSDAGGTSSDGGQDGKTPDGTSNASAADEELPNTGSPANLVTAATAGALLLGAAMAFLYAARKHARNS